ncbi:sulfotransferase family protein [Candidatus Pelagibacter bacterium]|nr:sulfotransferase family protein [Candidatus Pelagibacter bacterium]
MKSYIYRSRFKLITQIVQSLFLSIFTRKKVKGPNIVFIHIPKTGGTSIIDELENKIGLQLLKKTSQILNFTNKGPISFSHNSYLNLLHFGIVNNNFHNSSYKFCIVRNPYHRTISLFNYFKDIKIIDKNIEFEKFLDEVYLKRPPIGIYNHIGISQSNPQTDWILDLNGKFLVDDMFKLEELDKFINNFKDRFKVNLDIKVQNTSNKHITFEKIEKNKSIMEKIEKIYDKDFELLGYNKLNK